MTDTFPVVPYSKKDASAVLAELKQQIGPLTNNEWNSFLDASPDYALLKSAAALYDLNAFFCDQQVAETFLSLALQRESVIRRAKELNYIPTRAQPAQVTAKLTFPAFGEDLEIQAKSTWSIAGKSFICTDIIYVPAQQTEIIVPLIQGAPYENTIIANGQSWMKILLPVNASRIVVKVNDVEWTAVDTFIGVESRQSYKIYEDVGGQMICFGANVSTDKPKQGDSIKISAVLTDGEDGNIYQKDQNVRAISVLRDSDNNQINNLIKGKTTTLALYGQNVEDIESIRQNAPNFYGTQGRAVTDFDYKAIVTQYPGVKDVSVVGGEEIQQYRKVFITVYSTTPYEVADEFIEELTAYLTDKYRVLCIQPVVRAPNVVETNLVIDLGIEKASDEQKSIITNQANTVVAAYFSALKIKGSMYTSDLAAILKAIPRIRYSLFDFDVSTFASSSAGIINIPLCTNYDVSNCVLKDASGNVLFEGDGTSKVKNGKFLIVQPGLDDQKCTLSYDTTNPNIEADHDQVIVLKNLTIRGELV